MLCLRDLSDFLRREMPPLAGLQFVWKADGPDALAMQRHDAIVHPPEHPLHLMVAAFVQCEARSALGDDLQLRRQGGDVFRREMEAASEGIDRPG